LRLEGISDFEVDHGVAVVAVPHIGGKHGQSILRGSPSFFDGFEGIDGKGHGASNGGVGGLKMILPSFFLGSVIPSLLRYGGKEK